MSVVGLPGPGCCAAGKEGAVGPTGVCIPIGNPGKTGCPCIEGAQGMVGPVGPKKPSRIDKKSTLDSKAANNHIEKHDPDIIKKRLRLKKLSR